MHPDTVLFGFLINYFRAHRNNFSAAKFFLLFIFFGVAFYFLILGIGIVGEVIGHFLTLQIPN
jgi:hypothetical protein